MSADEIICDELYVRELITDGLTTDGGHHKQWYLEQLAIALSQSHILEGLDYEKGIAP